MTYGGADCFTRLYLQKLSGTVPNRVPEDTESMVKSALSPLAEVGLKIQFITDVPLTCSNFCDAVIICKFKRMTRRTKPAYTKEKTHKPQAEDSHRGRLCEHCVCRAPFQQKWLNWACLKGAESHGCMDEDICSAMQCSDNPPTRII